MYVRQETLMVVLAGLQLNVSIRGTQTEDKGDNWGEFSL